MAKIGRPRATLVVTEVERTELVRLTKRAHVNRLLAFRARLVLACADAPTGTGVARRYRTFDRPVVGKFVVDLPANQPDLNRRRPAPLC